MAGKERINSYLEAIVDMCSCSKSCNSWLVQSEREISSGQELSLIRYFMEEVIAAFHESEADLHCSWIQAASAARRTTRRHRNTRLENLCWRIWNMALSPFHKNYTHHQLQEEKSSKAMFKHHVEEERGNLEDTADNVSEDLLEGDITSADHSESTINGRLPPPITNSINPQKGKNLYIVLISLHGLIRGEDMELGRDSDTGGQVKYVVEFARALGSMHGVYRVDLLTRQISSPEVHWSYGEPTEKLTTQSNTEPFMDDNEMGDQSSSTRGSYIIRIPFGPKHKYIPKEHLWPHVPEFIDAALDHITKTSKLVGDQINGGKPVWPVAIHGHYADAGEAATFLSGALNVPMLFTGLSLGRDKLEQLLKQGRLTMEEINSTYKIMRRIEAEELSLDASELVITSTRQEIEKHWRLYHGFDSAMEMKLRTRTKLDFSCFGRFTPRMVIIPPGMELHHIVTQGGDMNSEIDKDEDPAIWSEIIRFFTNPQKPMVLALARPDPKKNLATLVKAFGECRPLRELANLTLIMGNRDVINEMSSTNASVLRSVLMLIDKYDLYGQVAYPKHHKQSDVPDIYRLAAKTKGIFINPALIEPFGLTFIEATAHGLPIVATKNGGPVDIHRVLDNGLLVDPHDQQSISGALLKLVADKQLWAKCKQNGLKNIHLFSWPEHCKTYLSQIASCKTRHLQWCNDGAEISEFDPPADSLRDMQDVSLHLDFTLDKEKNRTSEKNNNSIESKGNVSYGRSNLKDFVSNGISKDTHKAGFVENADRNSNDKFPVLRIRKHLIVIAVDCDTTTGLIETSRKIFEAARKGRIEGSLGFILSTSLSMSEINSLLLPGGFSPYDFDAVICNSGSDLYYPSLNLENSPFVIDSGYHSHIKHQWGGEGLRKTLVDWAASLTDTKDESEKQIVIDAAEQLSTNNCYAFKVHKPGMIPPVNELQKFLRIQALRCRLIYCQNGTRLNAIPVLASRCQALRYLYVRWGVEISKMVVFVGECGDTDYEGLLGGLHKTVVLKGICRNDNINHPLSDSMPFDSPNIMHTAEDCNTTDIQASLEKLGLLKD